MPLLIILLVLLLLVVGIDIILRARGRSIVAPVPGDGVQTESALHHETLSLCARLGAWLHLPNSTIAPGGFPATPQQTATASPTRTRRLIATLRSFFIWNNESELSLAALSWRGILLEWGLLSLVVIAYCASFLNGDPAQPLPGNESFVFQALDWVLAQSLSHYHQFPLWNPYLQTGVPYIADPMTHVFNPVVSLPVILFGVWRGFKLGVFFSFLIAALGMWRLARVLGMERPARLWLALAYVLAGQPAARFFQGQYLFILGFAWIPWAIGCLFLLARTGRHLYLAELSLCLALLFFSGNLYYAVYMIGVIALFALVMLFRRRPGQRLPGIDLRLFTFLGITGLISLGLIAIQLLPMIEFWPSLSKGHDIFGPHTPLQIIWDLTSKDSFRPEAYSVMPAREEFYAYIGYFPLASLVFIPLALLKRKHKEVAFFLLVLVATVLWINTPNLPWGPGAVSSTFLQSFRQLLRILVYTSFAILVLAALGLDALWRYLTNWMHSSSTGVRNRLLVFSGNVGMLLLAVSLLASLGDLYTTNGKHVQTYEQSTIGYGVMQYLRQSDLGVYYLRFNPNNSWYDYILAANLFFTEPWYHFYDIRQFQGQINQRHVQSHPNYIVQLTSEPIPEAQHEVVAEIEGYAIYRMLDSLPYTFSVPASALQDANAPELSRNDVIPQTPFLGGPNSLEVIAQGQAGDLLAMLITKYPGWTVSIDGQLAKLENLGGYMAVAMQPGVHQYHFSFAPRSFYIGLGFSLFSLIVLVILALNDLKMERERARVRVRAAIEWLKWIRQAPALWKPAWLVTTQATYHDRLLQPESELPYPEGTRLQITLEGWPEAISQPRPALQRWLWATGELGKAIVNAIPLEGYLFSLSLLVYLFTRLFALERFPIYFFTDEAMQNLEGQKLIANHFQNALGPLPMYIEVTAHRWAPLFPMYVHALSLSLFGTSIFVTRATSAVVSLLAAVSVSLILKTVFKLRSWWVGGLLLAAGSAWLIHSRTAFETAMAATFYACFLLCYLLYRTRSPGFIYPTILFAAATFYSYSNAQAMIGAAALLLVLTDLPYHLKQKRILVPAILLAVFVVWPLINFERNMPQAITEHLRAINSYWLTDMPLAQKLATYANKYTYSLSPQYWFFSNETDLPRHRMAGMGLMPLFTLPLVIVGLILCLRHIRSAPHRVVLLAALAVPVSGSLGDTGVTRLLSLVMPAAILAGLGLNWAIERLQGKIQYAYLALPIFLCLTWFDLNLLNTALVYGPTQFKDYGLYGMQYGAKQIFVDTIPNLLKQNPQAHIQLSSSWANNPDNFVRFFLSPEDRGRVQMGSADGFLFKRLPLDSHMIFIMTPAEYEKVVSSPKFQEVSVSKVIPYPDGTPGFYVAQIAYSDQADTLFNQEKEERRKLVETDLNLDGQPVHLLYSQIDMGKPEQIFDGDHYTLMRGLEANPFILEMEFSQPRPVSGLEGDFGLTDIDLKVMLYATADSQPVIYTTRHANDGKDPLIDMAFEGAPPRVSKVYMEIKNFSAGETTNIHIMEVKLFP